MAQSPQLDSDGPIRVTVLSGGEPLSDTVRFFSIRVQRSVGVIPSARLIVDDGDMPTGRWEVADGDAFAPGSEIVVQVGYGDSQETIFKGVVVKLGMRIDGENYSRLIVDCQDKAVKMTVGRNNANYVDKRDSDIISTLAAQHGLSVDVESTTPEYGELVQYYCTDWDFLISRAEVNGLLVIADDGKLSVKAPDVSQSADLKVTWGVDLVEFQADIDARAQLANVTAVAWDPKAQAIVEQTAPPKSLNKQGNLDSAILAQVLEVPTFTLQSATPLASSALSVWAKAQQVKSGLARIRGRMKFQGSARAKVGSLIELAGVGERYNGSVFVGGLEHEISNGNWFTEVDFGLPSGWFADRRDVAAPPAAGWLPGAEGLQIGIVQKLSDDPLGEKRIQVKLPVLRAKTEGVWARLAQYYASNGFGAFYIPEIGDEVVLGYFNNDPSNPVILGSLYSSKQAPPYDLTAKNNIKALVTRSKTKVEINDEDKIVTIMTPGNNQIVLSDKDKSIKLSDQNGNTVTLAPGGITLDSPKDITLTAKGSISASAAGSISLTAQADLTAKGLNVAAQAQVAFTGKGSASAELSASGTTTVRGAVVMIN
jgi:Rhs element Vgr protein